MANIVIHWTEYREEKLTENVVHKYNKLLPLEFQINPVTASITEKVSFYSKIKLSEILKETCEFPNILGKFSKDENGKPYLEGININFNISHSNNYIAYAICNDAEVGIDLQYVKDVKTALAKKVLHPDEFSSYETNANPSLHFIKLWARKEAVVKCTGKGIKTGFSTFSVLTDKVALNSVCATETVYVQDIHVLDGYKCAVASTEPNFNITVKNGFKGSSRNDFKTENK